MDEALVIARAVMIAGVVASLLQERFLNALDGRAAFFASVALSLGVGIAAVANIGIGFTATPADPFAFALEVLKVAGFVLVASQAAFRVFVKPIASA